MACFEGFPKLYGQQYEIRGNNQAMFIWLVVVVEIGGQIKDQG